MSVIGLTSLDIRPISADKVVKKSSKSFRKFRNHLVDGNQVKAAYAFCELCFDLKIAFASKNTYPENVKDAIDSAEAFQYVTDCVSESKLMLEKSVSEKYGQLVNVDFAKKISDEIFYSNITKKKIIKKIDTALKVGVRDVKKKRQ